MSSSIASSKRVNIKIVSDVVWPFCFIALRNLQKASIRSGVDCQVEWEPFLLDSSLPEEGEPYVKHLETKYGAANATRLKWHGNPLVDAGEKVGIKFTKDRIFYPTLKAHALLEYIKEKFDNEKVNELMEALFQSYFEEGKNINDSETLADIVQTTLGVHKLQALGAVGDTNLQDRIRAKDQMYRSKMRVKAVPFFIIEQNDGGFPVTFSGAYSSDLLAELLEEAADA